jgi:thiosulfate reductase cytochrome b subunit
MLKILNLVGARPHFRIRHFGTNLRKIKQTTFEVLSREFSEDKKFRRFGTGERQNVFVMFC